MNNESVETYEHLVEELLKDEPAEKRVEDLMKKIGLDYTQDPLQRINQVLLALHSEKKSVKTPTEE